MQNKRRILIIENQFVQFKDITKFLSNAGLDFFPDENNFIKYLDAIRIYLNPRYHSDRRDAFLEKVIEMTSNYDPELLIIDHILIGNHDGQDGIDLAIELRKNNFNQPIIFFSRTEQNNTEVCVKLPGVSHSKEWIPKGYSGKEILEDNFFNARVIPRIDFLLPIPLSDKIIKKLNERKQKLISSTTTIQREINNITEIIVELITNQSIRVSDDFFTNISNDDILDSKYLELLKSLISKNEEK